MKESSCQDPKMVANCQTVHLLEDKFNGLELNHIAGRFNKAADTLTKLASGQELVPTGIFASDLHKPSITYSGLTQDGSKPPEPALGDGPTPALVDPKVMQVDEDLETGPDPLLN
jgi:hypothetical protein